MNGISYLIVILLIILSFTLGVYLGFKAMLGAMVELFKEDEEKIINGLRKKAYKI